VGLSRVETKILDAQGNTVGSVELNESHFKVDPKPHVLHEVVRAQVNNYMKKTASSLTRAQVRGGGRKPFRQKGTGRARAGTRTSPLWSGGGVIFGPKPRVVKTKPPRSLRRQAFRMAWSDRFSSDAVIVVRDFGLKEIKTKALLATLVGLGGVGRVLIALPEMDGVIEKSARNLRFHPGKTYAGGIKSVLVKCIDQITVYDILLADRLFLTEESLKLLQARMKGV